MKDRTVDIIDITEILKQRTLDILSESNRWSAMMLEAFDYKKLSKSNEMWSFSTIHTRKALQIVFAEHYDVMINIVRQTGSCLYTLNKE